MLYQAIVPLIVKGDHIRKGEQIELSAEEAKQFDPADITPVSAVPDEEEEQEDAEPSALAEMSYQQLKEKAKELGLSQAGSRADLFERITLHLQDEVEEDMIPHIVTEDDLLANPDLAERGIQVGDEIMLPKTDEEEEQEEDTE